MPLKAGQEVDAYCTKCKMDLLHRIVAVVGGRPAKVECRTCMSVHQFRSPRSAVRPAATRTSSPAPAPRRSAAAPPPPAGPPAGMPVHPYVMTERYAPDQWIRHKAFGAGQVTRELSPDKIEVRFDAGLKTLVHNHLAEG